MRIYHNNLASTLQQSLFPVWLVFGDEPWQKDDSLRLIMQTANQNGFTETIRFSANEKFDWQQLLDEYQSLSLFSSQRIIEVELTSNKIGDAGSKALLSLSEHFHQDVLLIIHGGKADAATTNKKWFKTLSNVGCYLPIYDLDAKSLLPWLNRQAKKHQLNLSREATSLLSELFEGNLLALDQELQKLSLLFNNQTVHVEDLESIVIKQAKFNAFQLIDAMLQADCSRCISILDQLQQEGSSPSQIIWFMHKELKQLSEMQEKLQQGNSMAELYKSYRIWDKRKPLYQSALSKTSLPVIQSALSRLIEIDLISKTSSEFDPFILLADVCVSLYHPATTQNLSLNYEMI